MKPTEAIQKQIQDIRARAGLEALIEGAQALVAWTTRELHRVAGRSPRRWCWRYGINLRKALGKSMASAIFASVAAGKR